MAASPALALHCYPAKRAPSLGSFDSWASGGEWESAKLGVWGGSRETNGRRARPCGRRRRSSRLTHPPSFSSASHEFSPPPFPPTTRPSSHQSRGIAPAACRRQRRCTRRRHACSTCRKTNGPFADGPPTGRSTCLYISRPALPPHSASPAPACMPASCSQARSEQRRRPSDARQSAPVWASTCTPRAPLTPRTCATGASTLSPSLPPCRPLPVSAPARPFPLLTAVVSGLRLVRYRRHHGPRFVCP